MPKITKTPCKYLFALEGLILVITVFLSCAPGYSQEKGPLELKGEVLAKTVNGGEKLVYIFTLRNPSAETAKGVGLSHGLDGRTKFISASVSQGTYETNTLRSRTVDPRVWARFGDLQGYATATLTVEVKTADWGGEDEEDDGETLPAGDLPERERKAPLAINKRVLEDYSKYLEGLKDTIGDERTEPVESLPEGADRLQINYPYVFCDECTLPQEPERELLAVAFFPSKNKPPRVEIVSPKDKIEIVKKVNRSADLTVRIKASDTDGKVVKVVVGDMGVRLLSDMVIEDGERKIRIKGKSYTLAEFESDPDLLKLYETQATPIAKDTYAYTVKGLRFGPQSISVSAVDDGGRYSYGAGAIDVNVVGDANIGFASLKDEQVLRPSREIKIETVSTINDPELKELRIQGTDPERPYAEIASLPLLRKVGALGNLQRHEYTWKNVTEGAYNLRLMLFPTGSETYPAKETYVHFIVAEERVIKIFSLKNGQEFREGEPVKVSVDALDIKGRNVNDRLELRIDGKHHSDIYSSWQYDPAAAKNVRDVNYGLSIPYLEKGVHTLQVIAKWGDFGSGGPETGRSEPIVIRIK